MKKAALFLAFALCFQSTVCNADSERGYIVKLKNTNEIALFAATSESISNDTISPIINDLGLYSVETKEMCDELMLSGVAECAEENNLATLCDDIGKPDDPYYPAQQINIFQINAISAWNYGIYGNDVKIGYVDSGIYAHNELKNAIAGGYNYIDDTENYNDTYGHGTQGAAIIGAEANNFGGIGIAPRSKIYALKCFDEKTTDMESILKAIKGGVDTFGCNVINMSFSFDDYSALLADVINYASSKGVILVAAAGNDNLSHSQYPGAYPNVVSVASVNLNGYKNSFSNYGSGVNLVAVGSGIQSCDIISPTSYTAQNLSGTSFAAPCVTAAAALCLNINPEMTQSEFMAILNATCTPLKQTTYSLGAGMLNIENIMNYMLKGKDSYYSPVSTYNNTVFQIITNFGEEPLSFADIWKTDCGYGLKNSTVDSKSSYKSFFQLNSADNEIKRFVWKSMENLMPIYKYTNNS